EAEWLALKKPRPMLEFLEGKASDRKLRLFACAYARRNWHLLSAVSRKAVDVAERYAEGKVNEAERDAVAALALAEASEGHADAMAAFAATEAWYSLYYTAWSAACTTCDADACEWYVEQGIEMPHGSYLRDIFGNPFRPVTFDPAWRTATVTSLAQAIYDERVFDRMPILADALEDAGCTSADILGHCRGGGEHVRGCWVVDLVLGKE